MIVIRKHVLRSVYTDYGEPLDTVYRTATSVETDGVSERIRPISDGNYFHKRADAEAVIEAWLVSEEIVACVEAGAGRCERGPDIDHHCDMNPRGLI